MYPKTSWYYFDTLLLYADILYFVTHFIHIPNYGSKEFICPVRVEGLSFSFTFLFFNKINEKNYGEKKKNWFSTVKEELMMKTTECFYNTCKLVNVFFHLTFKLRLNHTESIYLMNTVGLFSRKRISLKFL